MTHAIAITRSQLRQVIEEYIAASRVGDTLSYVETARLSTAEAAESSTSRIWEGLCDQDEVPFQPSVARVLHVLERQIGTIRTEMDELAKKRDYSAEFRADDLDALERARRIVIESCGNVAPDEPSTAMAIGTAMHDLAEKALHSAEFTCAEDLAAGQVVIVNSRGMIEGKRDEADNLVHQVAQPEHLSPDDFF